MNRPLLRCVRFLSSLAEEPGRDTADAFVEVECLGEVELSVYEVDDAETSRVRSEHQASYANPPKTCLVALNLEGLSQGFPEPEVGTTSFQFANARHRILRILRPDQLVQLVRAALDDETRKRLTTPEEMRSYVRARFDADDAEWSALAEKRRKVWRKFSGAARNLFDDVAPKKSEPPPWQSPAGQHETTSGGEGGSG